MNKFLVYHIIFASIFSCSSINKDCVRVKEATYQPYQMGAERGYYISFQVKTPNAIPQYVVLNRLKQGVEPEQNTKGIYKVRVIAQTQIIDQYKVQGSNMDNGIMFKIGSKEVYKKVRFKIKD